MMPLVIDIVDMFSSFYKWSSMRKRYYYKKQYLVENYQVNDDGDSPVVKMDKPICDYASSSDAADISCEEDEDETTSTEEAPSKKKKAPASKAKAKTTIVECDWD